MIITNAIEQVVIALRKGDIIAYPTEAVFGLGCDPFNEDAVRKLLALKQRPLSKGLILITHHWDNIAHLTASIDSACLQRAQATWPGPATWIFPADNKVPYYLTGDHPGIALRVTQHPLASQLCETFDGPIVSTSANLNGHPPAKDIRTLHQYFPRDVALALDGPLGDATDPTPIRDVVTGQILRA